MSLSSPPRCSNCKQPVRGSSQFCASCGQPIQLTGPPAAPLARRSSGVDAVARVQPFNRWVLDWPDPIEAIGLKLDRFSLSQGYMVDRQRSAAMCHDIYEAVYQKLKHGSLEDVSLDVIDYQDMRYKRRAHEKARRYIRLVRETNRRTRTSVMARFRSDGDHIFIAVDAYILGGLDWVAFLRQLVLLPVGLLLGLLLIYQGLRAIALGPFDEYDPTLALFRNLLIGVYLLFLIYFGLKRRALLAKIIRSYRREHKLGLALRQCFPQVMKRHSFNEDDVLMFLKSALNMTADAVSKIFERYGIPAGQFVRYMMTINNYNSVIGDGTINQVGNQIGGDHNTMSQNDTRRP